MDEREDRCGAVGLADGSVRWRVWAPRVSRVDLVLLSGEHRRRVSMTAEKAGYFSHAEPNVPEGQRYSYSLDGGPERPDPCSRLQPDTVHGPSAVVRPERFHWRDGKWAGVQRRDLVFYEM